MTVIIEDFQSIAGSGLDYYRNGTLISDGAKTYYLAETEDVEFKTRNNPIAIYNEEGQTVVFSAPEMVVQKMWNYGTLFFTGDTIINGELEMEKIGSNPLPLIFFNGNTVLNCTINTLTLNSRLTFSFGYLNVDSVTWSNNNQNLTFGLNSKLQITPASIGKTLIKGNKISGTTVLDVQSGVNDGDSFSIEAADNQLVITAGQWTATPSTVSNVTTYTLTKTGASKKHRLLYTVDGGNRTLRFLGGTV